MPRHSTDASLDDNERSILERREKQGWFINIVAEDEVGPGFAYSFGLYERFNHPEIIIFGLPSDHLQTLVNEVGQHISSGVRYKAGDQADDLIEGLTCVFRHVNPQQYAETLTWTMWFYGNSDFPALQLFWPDRQGRFPWDSDFNELLRDRQPNLGQSSSQGNDQMS